jgi:hypothetical protein
VINNTGTHAYVAKYGPGGALAWVRQVISTGFVYPEGLAVDGAGNSYLSGYFTPGTIKFGSVSLSNAGGKHDLFLAKYDATGTAQWVRDASGASVNNSAGGVAVDAAGNVYQAGYFDSPTLNVSGTVLNNSSLFGSLYVGKYSPSGSLLWTETSASPNGFALGRDVGVDGAGNVYVAGEIGLANNVFGSVVLSESTAYNIFLTQIVQTPANSNLVK